MSQTPSPQQAAVYDWVERGTGSAIVEAVAGAGKTTTLVGALSRMTGSVAFCAYNKRIAAEIEQRVGQLRAAGALKAQVRVGTFHSFGFGAWRRVAPDVKVDDRKVAALLETLDVPRDFRPFVASLVSLAKQHGLGAIRSDADEAPWYDLVEHHDLDRELAGDALVGDGIRFAQRALTASRAADHTVIDFDDMLYAPLAHRARLWPNDWVLVDEAQDTNPTRRAYARALLKPGGRLIAVGDPHQAIYGFTGADADALELIRHDFNATTLPLTVTYRCPKRIVAEARHYVHHITAHESAPDGIVRYAAAADLPLKTAFTPGDAILCRNTAPLVELAYRLLRADVPCHVEGRDIGKGLLALTKRWKVTTLPQLTRRLEDYASREKTKLMAKGQELLAAQLEDRVATLQLLIEGSTDLEDLRGRITALFADSEPGAPPTRVILSTVHKSKGREWRRVYLWGANKYMPSPYARQAWQQAQEANLAYVAVTRAMAELVFVSL